MKNRLPKKYYIIPVLYIALVFGFLHLHLNEGDGRMVTQTLGSVTLRYREENGVRKNISRLNLEYAGMTADLSDGMPVMDASGRIDLVPINGVSLEERRLILFLDGGGS